MSTESIKEKERTSSESKQSKAHPNWGGKRKGAGRKPLTDRAFGSTILIRVSDEQKEYFRQKGASSWVRSLIEDSMGREFSALESSEAVSEALPQGALPGRGWTADPPPAPDLRPSHGDGAVRLCETSGL